MIPLSQSNPSATSRCGSRPLSASADLRSADDVIAFAGARALLNGLIPTLVGIVPYAGLSFATFETLKARYREKKQLQHDFDIPTPYRLAFGGVAGLFAQSVTYPLDLVRRRMQVAAPGEVVHYRGIVTARAKIALSNQESARGH